MRPVVGSEQARRDPALREAFERVERGGRSGLSSLKAGLGEFLRSSGLSRRRADSPVYAAFEGAAGPDLARRTRPVRFTRGTLAVEVDSAAHLSELEAFRGEELRARANALLGRPEIRRITFKLKA